MTDLAQLLHTSRRPRIVVVGDVILDRYLWGDVDRISPEAPIPLLRVVSQEDRLGGAGSVATMLRALETDVVLLSVVGQDDNAQRVRQLLDQSGVEHRLSADATRQTTTKQRILGRAQHRHPQQMLRVDQEQTGAIPEVCRATLLGWLDQALSATDLVLVSDYDKGVCAGDFIAQIVGRAKACGVPVIADPRREGDYTRYAGCRAITPNRSEAAQATGLTIDSPQQGIRAAVALLEQGVESVLVTLDRDGIAWAERSGQQTRHGLVPARPRQVYDITGAGDMVISVLGYALAQQAPLESAVELANLAGGLEVERLGVATLRRDDLLREVHATSHSGREKIVSLEALRAELQRRRDAGQQIVLTNGCFDLLHPGHVATLEAAAQQGDVLVVGLNSDRSVRSLKGAERPIIEEQGRAETLAALACVDYVILFDEPSVTRLVRDVRPDVLVKASEYEEDQIVGADIVRQYGGKVVRVPMKTGYSTSMLIERISQLGNRRDRLGGGADASAGCGPESGAPTPDPNDTAPN